MNKRLLTLSMVGLLTMTVTSCSDVSEKTVDGKQVIVTVGDENYTADDLLAKYGTTSSGVSAYYSAIYDVLIRDRQEITQNIQTQVSNSIDSFTADVKNAASSNGTTYNTELSNKLKEKKVNDLTELAEIYTLDEQKSLYESDWYSNRTTWDGKDSEKDSLSTRYINESLPYHIRHILVKTDSAGTSLYKGTISEEESLKLANVVKRLASGKESFGQIAQQASDDATSAAVYGSIDLLDLDTKSGYVSEFKYGVYAYDALFDTHTNNQAVAPSERASKLGIPEKVEYKSIKDNKVTSVDVKDTLKTIAEVPFTVINQLETYADKTKTEHNLTYVPNAGDGVWDSKDPKNIDKLGGQTINEDYYPRNILFNNYFNDHGLYVITKEGFDGASSERFKLFPQVSDKEILTDEKGNPILVTRGGSGESYQGVHFMIIEQSPFWFDQSRLDTSKPLTDIYAEDENHEITTQEYLRYYYSRTLPESSTKDVTDDQRFVTFVKSNRTEYEKRAKVILDAVKGFDSNIGYNIYETMLEEVGSKATIDSKIKESIDNMIAQKRASADYTKQQSNIASWKSYIELLNLQTQEKAVKQLDLQFIKMYDATYQATAIDLA